MYRLLTILISFLFTAHAMRASVAIPYVFVKNYTVDDYKASCQNWGFSLTPDGMLYLARFRDLLETRKGFAGWERAIQERYFYALLRVGPYTFSRYKVAWRYIARSFITAVIAPMQDPYLGETLPLPNEKVVYVGTDCREEAYYLCGILSSAPVRCCVTCYMNPTSISAHVLDKLHIPAFDPADSRHLSIAALCEEGHRASDPRCQDAVRQQLDRAVAALYGLTSADLDTVRSMLEKI